MPIKRCHPLIASRPLVSIKDFPLASTKGRHLQVLIVDLRRLLEALAEAHNLGERRWAINDRLEHLIPGSDRGAKWLLDGFDDIPDPRQRLLVEHFVGIGL